MCAKIPIKSKVLSLDFTFHTINQMSGPFGCKKESGEMESDKGKDGN